MGDGLSQSPGKVMLGVSEAPLMMGRVVRGPGAYIRWYVVCVCLCCGVVVRVLCCVCAHVC